MKKNNIIIATFVALIFVFAGCNNGDSTAKMPQLNSDIDSMNYAYGLFNGDQLKMMLSQGGADSLDYKAGQLVKGMRKGLSGSKSEFPQIAQVGDQVGSWLNQQKTVGLMGDSTLTINYNLIRQGLLNGIHGQKTLMTIDEAQTFVENSMRARQEKQMLEQYKDEKGAGEKFMAENAKKEGIIVTESGLQYEIIKAGNGPKPTADQQVKVHYHGTLVNGEVFDSSVDRGEPTSFGVSHVIKGWIEGLQLMPVGSKYKFYIPYDLAYGAQGTPGIPPFSPLIFEVELLEIIN